MDQHPLDGRYRISSTQTHRTDIEKKSDGITVIKNSRTMRYDDANCKWSSTFKIINEHTVQMVSVADPSEANVDFLLTAPNGGPTREPVTYKTTLKLSRKRNKIQTSEQIHYGHDVIFFNLTQSHRLIYTDL